MQNNVICLNVYPYISYSNLENENQSVFVVATIYLNHSAADLVLFYSINLKPNLVLLPHIGRSNHLYNTIPPLTFGFTLKSLASDRMPLKSCSRVSEGRFA